MELLILASVIIKLIASVLEISSQSLISQLGSVELFGEYSFFVALVDVFFWLFFAGIMKLNNRYIPAGISVKLFKRKYFYKYVAVISVVWIGASLCLRQPIAALAGFVGLFELYVMDTSSTLLSHKKYYTSLVGEYLVGRSVLIVAIVFLGLSNALSQWTLAIAYALQYCAIAVYFTAMVRFKYRNSIAKSKLTEEPEENKDIAKKFCIFQTTEIAHTVIMQSSVIVQYVFSGGFDTALVSIVLIVRKVINFITGPASKLYQPVFSRVCSTGDKVALSKVYSKITGIQLCVMVPVCSFLITQAPLVLLIFNERLVDYAFLIQYTSLVFLFMVIFGPLSNFLSMVGREKSDSVSNWLSILVMFAVMALFRDNRYFVVLGFCSQIIFSTIFKLVVYCKYMGCFPLKIRKYVFIFISLAFSIAVSFALDSSILVSLVACVVLFFIVVRVVYTKDEVAELVQMVKSKIARK